jgi:hypothetical protein
MDATSPSPDNDVDLDFTAAPVPGALPVAVDEHGLPLDGPRSSSAAATLGAGDADVDDDPLTPVHLPDLPRGDWTSIDTTSGLAGHIGTSRNAKVLIGVLLVALFVPMIVMLFMMLNNIAGAAPQ